VKQLNNSTIPAPPLDCADVLLDAVPLVMAAIRAEFQRCRPADLNAPQFRALAFIYRHGDAPLAAIADFLGLSLSSVSKLVDHLVACGYVRREVCREDRRRVHLRLTAKAQHTLSRALAQIRERLGGMLAGLDAPALAQTTGALAHLNELFALPSA